MAIEEVETSLEERALARDVTYDGFISYSHAADDLLAPRLQAAGLQRFANPRTRGADVTSLDAGMRTER